MAFPTPKQSNDLNTLLTGNTANDAVILITSNTGCDSCEQVNAVLAGAAQVDQRLGKETVLIHASELAGGRLIHAPTGPLDRDYDDVRRFADAAASAMAMAKGAGAKNPILLVEGVPADTEFSQAVEVSYLAACHRLWQPLEAREAQDTSQLEPVESITLVDIEKSLDVDYLAAVEAGRRLARDLCGTEPERMAPPKFADYCVEALAGSSVSVEVIDDQDLITREYPLLAAVGRASLPVPRHHARVINLTYEGEGPIEKTLYLVGKAVTFDVGGVDIKVGGHLAGMSRDKGGASAVAGFVKTVAELKPKGLKVVASLAAVRNSIGSDAFVPDEIITSRAGVRVRIGNTDAEGRLAMADLLSRCREQAKEAVAPELMTVATLTGHAALTVGPYTLLVENGFARDKQMARQLAEVGEQWGDCMEISLSRREDWHFIRPRTAADDVLSSNNGTSVSVARGHQFPMAFLAVASGLDKHGAKSEQPLPYMHIDIAGSGIEGGDWQSGSPTAAPCVALAAHYLR
ncbi:leucyl aminopeptidase family protein [Pseudomaricurvus alkylphenolicus]|uniref:M17 family metallopeptidase n=1 Tax=Pseudomaricurvus alkylphenolicus TaxID=1306991 RepID=UPI001420EA15|nr:leucyl aminopeptidase family protein [Pseudomaricurvus alkylphenolicus]NIB44888.1 leucyl aminopeptidase family protein [Pseudomaricurvus alkylphenolicus]